MPDGFMIGVIGITDLGGPTEAVQVDYTDGRVARVERDPKIGGKWKYSVRLGEWCRAGHGFLSRRDAIDDAGRNPDKRFA